MSALPISALKTTRRMNSMVPASPVSIHSTRDTAEAGALVLALRIHAEDLCKVLDVDAAALVRPIETLDHECVIAKELEPVRQPLDVTDRQRARLGHLDADAARELRRRELVLGNARKFRRGEFDDPRATDAVGRSGGNASGSCGTIWTAPGRS